MPRNLTPDQEKTLDLLGAEIDVDRTAMLDEQASLELMSYMYENGILQPEDL